MDVSQTTAPRRMSGFDTLYCIQHVLLAQQLGIHIEEDSIVDTKVEMEWSGNNASGVDP